VDIQQKYSHAIDLARRRTLLAYSKLSDLMFQVKGRNGYFLLEVIPNA